MGFLHLKNMAVSILIENPETDDKLIIHFVNGTLHVIGDNEDRNEFMQWQINLIDANEIVQYLQKHIKAYGKG